MRISLKTITLSAAGVAILMGGLTLATWPSASPPRPMILGDVDTELAVQQIATVPAIAGAVVEAELAPATVSRILRVAKGDTLMGMLVGAGLDRTEAHNAIGALRGVYDPRRLRPGHEIRLSLLPVSADAPDVERLLSLNLQPDVERDVVVRRDETQGFLAEAIARPLEQKSIVTTGTIESSLSVAAASAGLPATVLNELVRLFSFDVDFQREIQPGDGFEAYYGGLFEIDGTLARPGDIEYAALTLSGKRIELYKFTPKSGITDFFGPKGESVRKTLMRTPIDGARLSSGFGMRRHPVLGYSKMHRGTDFAAPRGTPIYAAGNGVIEVAGRKGSYGNYIRIRHNSTYKTAYAHMSRLAKSSKKGARVKQGQVIGYVGTTGRSTGPHLHYEVMVNGKQVNSLKVKVASGEQLKGADLKAFAAHRDAIDQARARARNTNTLLAQASCTSAEDAERISPTNGGEPGC